MSDDHVIKHLDSKEPKVEINGRIERQLYWPPQESAPGALAHLPVNTRVVGFGFQRFKGVFHLPSSASKVASISAHA